jgi:holliday junction DNA helicase RuvA
MYAHLNGKLMIKKAPWIVLDIGGIGYELQVPMTTYFILPELNQMVNVFTHFVVREDAHSLYGFMNMTDRDLFRELIRVSGVGPKVALSILSTLPAAEFVQCVEESKIERLTKVPGIGKKTAERLLIELRDRLKYLECEMFQISTTLHPTELAQSEAIQALVSLGYSIKEAKSAVSQAPAAADCETILRGALQGFSK